MDLQLTILGQRPITRQIYDQLRERVIDGRLQPGEKLPSTRELAEELAVARKTVTNVFDMLLSEGLLESRRGAGTYVARSFAGNYARTMPGPSPIRVRADLARLTQRLAGERISSPFDFNVGIPDISRFPFPHWRSLLASRARMLSRNASPFAEPQGYEPLRETIAGYIGFTRAVVCTARDIVITNGAQQAFALLCYALIGPGTVVAFEHPGYERARWLFELHGAKVAEVPVDEQGLIVERLPDAAKVIYVTPSHQFPLGVRLSLARRMELLEWAARRGAAIIEDDYDSEFRYESRPLDSLQSLDQHGVVFYVGTFSKVLFPGVRSGFVVAPQPVRDALVAARQLTDWHGPLLTQATLTRFIHEGHLARHIRKMRTLYAERRRLLLRSFAADPKVFMDPWPSSAGLHLSVRLPPHISADRVAQLAAQMGVGVTSLGEFGLMLGFGAIETSLIEEGVDRIRRAINSAAG
jgi:GntR family transcriptional regulator/MocR family aminotransferase